MNRPTSLRERALLAIAHALYIAASVMRFPANLTSTVAGMLHAYVWMPYLGQLADDKKAEVIENAAKAEAVLDAMRRTL